MQMRNTVFSTAILAAIMLVVGASVVDAKVRIKERTKYYTVSGDSGSEIFRSMVKRGPKLGGFALRKKALATAKIQIAPRNIKVVSKNGRCRIASLDVRVDVQYTLPKWRGSKRASRATRNAWSRFSKIAAWHEKQHTRIAKEHAGIVEKTIRRLRPVSQRRCNARSFRIEGQVRSLERQHEIRQAAFDRKDLGKGGKGYKAQMQLLRAE